MIKAQHIVGLLPVFRAPGLTDIHEVLVHGEQTAMGRLRAAMTDRYKSRDEDVKIHTPRNLETLELTFRGERVAKVRAQPSVAVIDQEPSMLHRPLAPLRHNLHNQEIRFQVSLSPRTTLIRSLTRATCGTSLVFQHAWSHNGRK